MPILAVLKALADSTRLRMLAILSGRELAVNEIGRVLGMGQSRVSRHLRILAEAGLLDSRRDGLWVYYSAGGGHEAQPLVAGVLERIAGEPQQRADRERAMEVLRERQSRTRRFFDSIAGSWEKLRRELLGGFDLNRALAERAAPDGAPRCRKALDVGCGTGELLACLADRAETVVGVDSSPGMLEQARRRFRGRAGVELRLGEAEHLPVRDGEADLAVMSMVLHHLSRPEEALREAARVLQPGRSLLIAELGRHGEESLRERFGDRWLGFEPSSVEAWLREAGFRPAGGEKHELRPGLELWIYVSKRLP